MPQLYQNAKKRRHLRIVSRILAVLAVLTLLAGMVTTWWQWRAQSPATPPAITNNPPSGAPSVERPTESDFDKHQVAPDEPRYLFIPKISVRAMVKSVGLTTNKAIDAPNNNFVAGWYTSSAKPGQAGAMLIDGHIGVGKIDGIFHDLKKLSSGDEVSIQRGDGVVVKYRVVRSQTYPVNAVDMRSALRPVNGKKSGLNLITCDGEAVAGTNDYSQRLVVFTEQI